MRVMNLNKLIFLQLRGPEGKKIPKAISDFGVDNSKYTIISLRTVAALRKQSCGLFFSGSMSIVVVTRKIEYMIITSDRNYAVACFVVELICL